jgi:uncharacterized protein YkwD
MTQLKQKNPGKAGNPLFKFFLVLEIIIAIAAILYGIIQSNQGYPSIDEPPPGGKIGPARPPDPGTVKVNISNLKQDWHIPGDPARGESPEAKLEKMILEKINEKRGKKGLPILQWERGLADTALYHSTDMGKNKFFDHQNLDNIGFSLRIAKIHRRYAGGSAGENLLKIDKNTENPAELAERAITAWMNSTGHRENILADSFDCAGVGCFEAAESDRTVLYCTLVLGEKIGYLTDELPQKTKPNQEIFVRVNIVKPEKYLAPGTARIINIESSARHGNFTLKTHNNTQSSAAIKTPADEGIYQLVFPIPYVSNPDTFEIVKGPLFVVKKDK